MTRALHVVYDPSHLEGARAAQEEGATVLCLDFLLERSLGAAGVPFISGSRFKEVDTDEEEEWWKQTFDIAREWYRIPEMAFLAHEGIRIAEAPESTVNMYLARLFYYARIYRAVGKEYPEALLHLPPPGKVDTSYWLAPLIAWAPVDAARLMRMRTAAVERSLPPLALFLRASRKSRMLGLYNALIKRIAPRKSFTVYASEYWTHLAPVIRVMKDIELVLLESRGWKEFSWPFLFSHRVRFRHSREPIAPAHERAARQLGKRFSGEWQKARGAVARYLETVRSDVDWSPVLESFDRLIAYAPRVAADIDTLARVMREERPDLVLVMASTGGPEHYFFLMAKVARMLGIPSLELQHATATVDPRSLYSRIETDYLATYGEDINAWHANIGAAPQKLIAVGSPRFDRYVRLRETGTEEGKRHLARLGLDPSRPVLCAAVPYADEYVCTTDSYELAEFFESLRRVLDAVPGLQILFKFRSPAHVGGMRAYLETLFPKDVAFAAQEPLYPLFLASDGIVCNNSTALYEAVLAQKPLVLFPWKPHDSYHAQVYEKEIPLFHHAESARAEAALVRLYADPSYRADLMRRQAEFLSRYSFDGRSSERVADLLVRLARRKPR